MSEKIINYLKIQIATGRLTKEQVIEKYPEMKEHI